uniref:Uncharacterized protein n=1 Tax=Anguilla anguilla TaxID=7936 RepID=A0A0E9RTA5_ANGAN
MLNQALFPTLLSNTYFPGNLISEKLQFYMELCGYFKS